MEGQYPYYVYYVAFAHEGGFGGCEYNSPMPIDSYAHVKTVVDFITESGKARGVAVINWVLLSGPAKG